MASPYETASWSAVDGVDACLNTNKQKQGQATLLIVIFGEKPSVMRMADAILIQYRIKDEENDQKRHEITYDSY
jgi:hypothetical protein